MLPDISLRHRQAFPVSLLLWMSCIKLPTCRPLDEELLRSGMCAFVHPLLRSYCDSARPHLQVEGLKKAVFHGIAPRLCAQSIRFLFLYLFRNMTSESKSHLQVESLEEALLSSVALRLRARHGQGRRARRVTDHVAARLRLHHALLDQVLELQRTMEKEEFALFSLQWTSASS